jgi:hypothetical protein
MGHPQSLQHVPELDRLDHQQHGLLIVVQVQSKYRYAPHASHWLMLHVPTLCDELPQKLHDDPEFLAHGFDSRPNQEHKAH